MTEQELAACYQSCLDPRERNAQAVLQDLASKFHIGTTTHVPGDAQASAFREGQRAAVLYIFGQVSMPLVPGQQQGGV